ncbi:Organic cation transporter protein [Hordeum vulgare]|nr:Organic cation transporter protein [Hordeum vulgare]
MAGSNGSSSSSGWTGKNLEDMLQHLDLKDEELDDVVVGEEETNPAEVVLDGIHVWAQIHGIPDMYRSTDIVDQLARRIGRVKEIQLSPRLFYTGDYVRVRARILVGKPLTRVTALVVSGEGRRMFTIKYEKTPYFCQVCGLMGHNHEECGDGVWEAKQKQWGSWMLARRKEVASGKREEDQAGRGGRSGGRARTDGRGRAGNRGHTSPARKRSSQDAGLDDGQG